MDGTSGDVDSGRSQPGFLSKLFTSISQVCNIQRIIDGFQLFCCTYVLANNTRVVLQFESCMAPYTTIKIQYNPCIIRQYIHSKTAENHLLLSNYYSFKKLARFDCTCRPIETSIYYTMKSQRILKISGVFRARAFLILLHDCYLIVIA